MDEADILSGMELEDLINNGDLFGDVNALEKNETRNGK